MKKWAIVIILLLGVIFIAAKGTQVFAPFFTVPGEIKCGSLVTDSFNTASMTLTGTVSADSVYGDTVTTVDLRATVVTADSANFDGGFVTIHPTLNKVGVGDNTPDATFEVFSAGNGNNFNFVGDNSTNTQMLLHNTGTSGDPSICLKTSTNVYWTLGVDNNESDDFRICGTSSLNANTNQYFHIETDGSVIVGSEITGDSTLNVNGSLYVVNNIYAADSIRAADRVKVGDNTTFSLFEPGDAALTTSSSRRLKNIEGVLQVDLEVFSRVPVYRWKYKSQYSSNSKQHYGAVAEEFKAIYGDGQTIDYEKAFWYQWGVTKELVNRIKKLEARYEYKGDDGSNLFDSSGRSK